MKHNLENIPEVSIDKVDAFYVTGTQHRDAAGKTNNLKLNLKTLGGGGIDLTDKEALKALWNALQDAIAVVITNDDVEEQVDDDYIFYEVLNTEGFPDETWTEGDMRNFRPKVVGVFRDTTGGVEYQVSAKLNFGDSGGPGSFPTWMGVDNQSGCNISLTRTTDAWELSVLGEIS